jgi:hypothetical protein
MNSATSCSNHNAIPHYQSIDRSKDTYRDEPSIDYNYNNRQLSNLTPKGRLLAETIGMIAAALFPLIGTIALHFTPLIIFGSALSFSLITVGAILKYKSEQNEINNVEKDISTLFKKYTKEFSFLERKSVPLITIKEDDFNLIKPFCSEWHPLQCMIREKTHFKLEGGIIGTWSITPLKLEKVCTMTNSEGVIARYKPWIDLLITLAKQKDIPEDFLHLLGNMGGFKQSIFEGVIYNGKNYTCAYNVLKKYIICLHNTDKSKHCVIKTPQECLAFMEKEQISNS